MCILELHSAPTGSCLEWLYRFRGVVNVIYGAFDLDFVISVLAGHWTLVDERISGGLVGESEPLNIKSNLEVALHDLLEPP